jgi:hypothetical protein
VGSSIPEYSQNHQIDPKTGFTENPAYLYAFDSERKKRFLNLYRSNGLMFNKTCKQLGLSHNTVNKHYQTDPEFKVLVDEAERDYTEELEAVSRRNALKPRFYVERIFQLKTLKPEKYDPQRNMGASNVTINIDTKQLSDAKKVDAIEIDSKLENSKEIEYQEHTSAKKEAGDV